MDGRSLNCRGFTLIELLLAVGLSALMVGVVMGTYVAIRRGVAESLVSHEAEVEGAMIVNQIMLDLEAAYLGNPAFPERFFFEGKVSEMPWQTTRLSFASARAGEGREGLKGIADLGRITYRLKPLGEEKGRFLMYRDLAPLQSRYPAKEELISDRITLFRVVYEDGNRRVSRQWDSRAQQWRDRLPALVRIEVTVVDARGKQHTFRGETHPMQDWME